MSVDCPTYAEATGFFTQLEAFSAQARQRIAGRSEVSPNGGTKWQAPFGGAADGASGIIIHYTAGPTLESAVRWFLDPANKSSSAHCVIGRQMLSIAGPLDAFPMLKALPTTVVLCRSMAQTAWSATWANPWAFSIELASIGVMPAGSKKTREGNDVLAVGGRLWEGFTADQLKTCAIICRYAQTFYRAIQPHMVLGHEQVQGVNTPEERGNDKRDPGVSFPWTTLRKELRYPIDPPRLGDKTRLFESDMSVTCPSHIKPNCAEDLDLVLRYIYQDGGKMSTPDARTTLAMTQLANLGYEIVAPLNFSTAPNLDVLKVFQHMMGLKVDGVCGPMTCRALLDRLIDRRGPYKGNMC